MRSCLESVEESTRHTMSTQPMATESTVKRQPPRARLLTAAAGGKAVVGEASKPIEREKNLFPNLKGGKLYTSSSKSRTTQTAFRSMNHR